MDTTALFPPASADGATHTDDHPTTPRPPADRAGSPRLWRGPASDPSWARPGLLGLLAATAVLLFWGLTASGWANAFYSAAVQAGTRAGRRSSSAPPTPRTRSPSTSRRRRCGSWRCRCGSSASARGASSCPRRSWASPRSAAVRHGQAPVRRRRPACSPGRCSALTPVAVLMFRFNNPDALLVLLMTARRVRHDPRHRAGQRQVAGLGRRLRSASASSPRCCRRSWSCRRSRWPTWSPRRRRCAGGSCTCSRPAPRWSCRPAGGSRSSSSCPPRARPYIGGSQNNSILELTLGYNGLGRITGNETGSVGGGGGGAAAACGAPPG